MDLNLTLIKIPISRPPKFPLRVLWPSNGDSTKFYWVSWSFIGFYGTLERTHRCSSDSVPPTWFYWVFTRFDTFGMRRIPFKVSSSTDWRFNWIFYKKWLSEIKQGHFSLGNHNWLNFTFRLGKFKMFLQWNTYTIYTEFFLSSGNSLTHRERALFN